MSNHHSTTNHNFVYISSENQPPKSFSLSFHEPCRPKSGVWQGTKKPTKIPQIIERIFCCLSKFLTIKTNTKIIYFHFLNSIPFKMNNLAPLKLRVGCCLSGSSVVNFHFPCTY